MGRVLFVTGTDTGVGKTAVTALLLAHALDEGINVRALKPFSTGSHGDEALLAALQPDGCSISFFHYPEPVSPWTAARLHNRRVTLPDVIARIEAHQQECDLLLVEGAGGLLTPLGERFSAAEIIKELSAQPIVVAPNRLGVINHTLLTIEVLRSHSAPPPMIVIVEQAASDLSRKTNVTDLRELLPSTKVVVIPYLQNFISVPEFIRRAARELKPILAELLG